MTASVVRGSADKMTLQSTPNPQMYQSSGSPYYGNGYSVSNLLMTSMMMSMLFRPPYIWGGGFGYGYGYGTPMTVSSVQNRKGALTSKIKKATPSSSSAKTAGGKSVTSNKFRSTSKKSLNNIKSTKFRSANRSNTSGGFGRGISQRNTSVTKRRIIPRKRSSFGGMRRSRGFSFGGFGRRRR